MLIFAMTGNAHKAFDRI